MLGFLFDESFGRSRNVSVFDRFDDQIKSLHALTVTFLYFFVLYFCILFFGSLVGMELIYWREWRGHDFLETVCKRVIMWRCRLKYLKFGRGEKWVFWNLLNCNRPRVNRWRKNVT